MKHLLLAFQFLTVVPVRVKGDVTEADVAASAPYFPFVGAFQGIVVAVAGILFSRFLPPDVAAGLAILCLIITNHGFDLDGVADTFDALAVKSSGDARKDRAKRLTVMKDSTTGAAGVVAIVMVLLLKFVLVRTLLAGYSASVAGSVLFFMPVVTKWLDVPVMFHGASARPDGLGKIFVERTGVREVVRATWPVAVFLAVAAAGGFRDEAGSAAVFYGAACAGGYGACVMAVRFFERRFGGLTGDHFGAIVETGEVAFLLAAIAWLSWT
jgi:adenosylcobinamide-GDP ribazoletransferase